MIGGIIKKQIKQMQEGREFDETVGNEIRKLIVDIFQTLTQHAGDSLQFLKHVRIILEQLKDADPQAGMNVEDWVWLFEVKENEQNAGALWRFNNAKLRVLTMLLDMFEQEQATLFAQQVDLILNQCHINAPESEDDLQILIKLIHSMCHLKTTLNHILPMTQDNLTKWADMLF